MISILLLPYQLVYFGLGHAISFGVCLTLFYALCHRLGIVKRLLQRWIEVELTRESNGAQITISGIEFNLFQFHTMSSTIVIKDLIIHSPEREDWKWDSPLVARLGTIYASFNLMSLLKLPPLLTKTYQMKEIFNPMVRDVYSIQVQDVQLFIEKRRNVFNFHLLDPKLDIPDAAKVMSSLEKEKLDDLNIADDQEDMKMILDSLPYSNSYDLDTSNINHNYATKQALIGEHMNPDDPNQQSFNSVVAETRANEIVMQMLGAVSSLGQAAEEGGRVGLSNALKNQKEGFITHLKKFQNLVGLDEKNQQLNGQKVDINGKDDNRHVSRTTIIAKESLKVIKEVGKVVEKNVLNMKEQVDSLAKPPPRKEGWTPDKNPDLFRVGNIVIHDIRIFTKDIILARGTNNANDHTGSVLMSESKNVMPEKKRQTINNLGWSKPIHIPSVVIPSAELCPPPNLKRKQLPIVGQPIEAYANVLLRRILTEMAKSSTGQLLHNAFGEVFAGFAMEVKGSRTPKLYSDRILKDIADK